MVSLRLLCSLPRAARIAGEEPAAQAPASPGTYATSNPIIQPEELLRVTTAYQYRIAEKTHFHGI